jgi:ubiquinone biosynthesis protein COQ4
MATLPIGAPAFVEDRSPLERLRLGFGALARLKADPDDTQAALDAALNLNARQMPRVRAMFARSEEGARVLHERPAIDCKHVDLARLAQLPEGTLGRSYSRFLTSRGLTPEVFVAPRELRDEDSRYIAQRLRQTHDLWHVLTGYDTDVLGEIELQAFTFAQLKMPFAFVIASFGVFFGKHGSRLGAARRVLRAYVRGLRAEPLCFRAYEERFATPLERVRAELGLA